MQGAKRHRNWHGQHAILQKAGSSQAQKGSILVLDWVVCMHGCC